MFKSLALTGLALSFSAACFAAPVCTSGSLTSYIGLGSSGCTINNTTFADFNQPSGQEGLNEILASAVTVTPFQSAGIAGFTFGLNSTASAQPPNEAILTYQVLNGPYLFSNSSLNGASFTNDGGTTLVENFCAGGTFDSDGVSNCTGNSNALILDANVEDMTLADGVAYGPVSQLSVTDDVTLDPGSSGTASITSISNSFSTPEPSTFVLLASGGLGLALLRRRRDSRMIPVDERKD